MQHTKILLYVYLRAYYFLLIVLLRALFETNKEWNKKFKSYAVKQKGISYNYLLRFQIMFWFSWPHIQTNPSLKQLDVHKCH